MHRLVSIVLTIVAIYERLNAMPDDRTKVENLVQHLEGPAADWLTVLQDDLKSKFILDEYGFQTSQRNEIS
jgi:hypothetical protein